ncbi:MAG TPA: sialidase family protein [Steroidobacteraceae bacterium]|nr:sialidase family protein [Steroidobacteraceae bacterium]
MRLTVTCLTSILLAAPAIAVSAPGNAAVDRSVVVSLPAHRSLAPEIAVAPDGVVYIVWLDKGPAGAAPDPARTPQATSQGHSHQSWTDLMFARSTDGGRTFSAPARINRESGEVWGFAVSKPRIGVGPSGTVHVYYPANATSPATGKPVAESHYVRSLDGGKSFSAPLRLNSHATVDASEFVHGGLSNAHAFGTMSVARDGAVFAFWIDTRAMARQGDNGMLYSTVSRDDGATFAADGSAFPADICPCCQLTAVAVDSRVVYVGARQVSGDNLRDSTVARSDDGGRTFGERVRVGGERWKINGCPLKPTALAVDGDYVYAASHNGAEQRPGVYFARSSDRGAKFTDYQALHPDAPVSDAPALTVSRNTVVAAWHAKSGEGRRVYYRASEDRGVTFGSVQELSAPAGNASLPVLAAAPDGRVHLAWQHDDTIRTLAIELPQKRVAAAHTVERR